MSQPPKKKEKDYAALSAAFTSRIDSLIPLDFGKPKTQPNASSSTSAYVEESAEEILEKNRKKRMAVRHRQIIAGTTDLPSLASSSSAPSPNPNIPLPPSLKRKHAESASNGTASHAAATAGGDNDDDDDEEAESKSRSVGKKSKLSKDLFATKKSRKKVNREEGGGGGMEVDDPQPNGKSGAGLGEKSKQNGKAQANGASHSPTKPKPITNPTSSPTNEPAPPPPPATSSTTNPFKLNPHSKPSSSNINHLFSPAGSPRGSSSSSTGLDLASLPKIAPSPGKKKHKANPSNHSTVAEQTDKLDHSVIAGGIPIADGEAAAESEKCPPHLKGKERKKWKKAKKREEKRQAREREGGGGDAGVGVGEEEGSSGEE